MDWLECEQCRIRHAKDLRRIWRWGKVCFGNAWQAMARRAPRQKASDLGKRYLPGVACFCIFDDKFGLIPKLALHFPPYGWIECEQLSGKTRPAIDALCERRLAIARYAYVTGG